MTIIAPSILSANFSALGEEIKSLDKTSAEYIHIDVMDGVFVPNLTFGAPIVKSIRKLTEKVFDVHLMVCNPESHVESFKDAGADIISFHYEATNHHQRLLNHIRQMGCKAGIALNPSTSEENLKYILDDLDQIIVMTVNPGFGGQSFLESQLQKVSNIKKMIGDRNIKIEIDGGVSDKNSSVLIQKGANILVAGTSVFCSSSYEENIQKIRNI